jgi:hypothetical protein
MSGRSAIIQRCQSPVAMPTMISSVLPAAGARAHRVPSLSRRLVFMPFSPMISSLLRPGRYSYLGKNSIGPDGVYRLTNAHTLPLAFRSPLPSRRFSVPAAHWVPETEWRAEFQGDWLFVRNRSSIVVDGAKGLCARVPDAHYFTHDYEVSRRIFEKHVNSVEFSVLAGRYAVIEAIVDGRALEHQADDVKLQALESLKGQFVKLATEAPGAQSESLLRVVCESSKIDLARSRMPEVMNAFAHLPLVPVHGDVSPSNVFMAGNAPVLIDFGNLRWGLGFENLLSIALMRTELSGASFYRGVAGALSDLELEPSPANLELALIASRAMTLAAKPTSRRDVAHLPKRWLKWNEHLSADLELLRAG